MPAPASASADPQLSYGPAGRSAWLDVDWQAAQRWESAGGRAVNVVELGPTDGEAIVWIHGLSGSWQNWLENLPALADAGFRCVALDLPGFGASPMPAETISISGYAALVDELMGTLGLDAACVVGNSMGGFIAAELAIAFPARVERLVLVSAAGISIEHMRDERQFALLRRAERLMTMYGGWLASRSEAVSRRARLRRATFSIVAAHPERLSAPVVAESLRGSGTPGFVDAMDALTSYPIKDRLPEIACPTLIVWGTKDRLVPVRDADEFERLIPDARKVVWPDTGHVSMIERPDAFNALVAEFLAEEPNEDVEQDDASRAAAAREG